MKSKAAVRNSNILAALNGDLRSAIVAQKHSPLSYRQEFRDTAELTELFCYHEEKIKIIKIIE